MISQTSGRVHRTTAVLAIVAGDDQWVKGLPEFRDLPAGGTVRFEPADLESKVPEQFHLEAHDFDYRSKLLREGRAMRIARLTFPSPVTTEIAENNTVHA